MCLILEGIKLYTEYLGEQLVYFCRYFGVFFILLKFTFLSNNLFIMKLSDFE